MMCDKGNCHKGWMFRVLSPSERKLSSQHRDESKEKQRTYMLLYGF